MNRRERRAAARDYITDRPSPYPIDAGSLELGAANDSDSLLPSEAVDQVVPPRTDPAPASPLNAAQKALAIAQWVPIDWAGYRVPTDRLRAVRRARVTAGDGRSWAAFELDDGRRVIGRYEAFALPGERGAEAE